MYFKSGPRREKNVDASLVLKAKARACSSIAFGISSYTIFCVVSFVIQSSVWWEKKTSGKEHLFNKQLPKQLNRHGSKMPSGAGEILPGKLRAQKCLCET